MKERTTPSLTQVHLKFLFELLFILGCTTALRAQQSNHTITINIIERENKRQSMPEYLNGFSSTLSGQTITYHSSHPDAESALLVRARRDAASISWLTDTLGESFSGEFYRFVWLAGIERIGWGNASTPHTFDLYINNEHWFRFTNRKDSSAQHWAMTNDDGSSLSFDARFVDRFGDLFGYMYLSVSKKKFLAGAPLTLRVVGEDADSPEWYMVFQYRFNFVPKLRVEPALVKDKQDTRSLLRLSLDNLQNNRTIEISSGGSVIQKKELSVGANIFFLQIPTVTSTSVQKVSFAVNEIEQRSFHLSIQPVKPLEIYLLSHTHNDIGYTDVQPNVERKQWNNLDMALRLIKETERYPPESRYKWNMEILWSLESYLKNASEQQREEVLNAIRNGSIGMNALLVNPLTGLANALEMSHFTDYARTFSKTYSIPITTAAVSDIPGFTWGIVSALAQSGIKYFASAPNSGDRIGYVLEQWGDKPFYWMSQSGKQKVLFWVAGSSYSSFHEGTLSNLGPEKIMKLVRKLDENGYPYSIYYLPYTLGDNGSPDSTLPEFVRTWNERYVSPKLIVATHQQMFEEFERRYGSTLPEFKGDFTPYWEDGAASTAYETSLNRRVVDRLTQAEVISSLRSPETFPESSYYHTWRNVVLWGEHTWGADKSITNPDDAGVNEQWRIKQRYVLDADSASSSLFTHALSPKKPSNKKNALDIYNTNSWRRTDIVYLTLEQSKAGDAVVDKRGKQIPSQRLSTGELAVLMKGVEPLSATRIFVQKGKAYQRKPLVVSTNSLSNEFFSLDIDLQTGGIKSLILKKQSKELADSSKHIALNQYFYVAGKNPNSARGLSDVIVSTKEKGNLVSSLFIEGTAPGCKRFSSEVRIFSGINRIDIVDTMDKIAIRSKEGIHIAFPFLVPDGRVHYNVADGIVQPERDQLAGSCKNFFSVESWVDVSNNDFGVTWITHDAPLVELGAITAESPRMKTIQPAQTLYSYVMNNYWHTNYKADQEGVVEFAYSIVPHGEFRPQDAVRLGIERRQPLLVAVADGKQIVQAPFTIAPNDIVIESIRPVSHGASLLLRLYNSTNQLQGVLLSSKRKHLSVVMSDSFGHRGVDISHGFTMKEFDSEYVLITLK